jgi:hypothetical protein
MLVCFPIRVSRSVGLAGKIILPPSCMAICFIRQPWYLQRNKYLFSYEVSQSPLHTQYNYRNSKVQNQNSEFLTLQTSEFQKKNSDRNLRNQKQKQNSAYNGGPRNCNIKLEFPTKIPIDR